MSCSVFVLPVPVAPAMSPCRLSIASGMRDERLAAASPSCTIGAERDGRSGGKGGAGGFENCWIDRHRRLSMVTLLRGTSGRADLRTPAGSERREVVAAVPSAVQGAARSARSRSARHSPRPHLGRRRLPCGRPRRRRTPSRRPCRPARALRSGSVTLTPAGHHDGSSMIDVLVLHGLRRRPVAPVVGALMDRRGRCAST